MGIFVVQKHYATHLHYDFRIGVGGVLKSWAVPKGPSRKIGEKRLAILVADHAMSYAKFEGTIPEGEYGAGKVIIWDHGKYKSTKKDKEGKLIPIQTCLKKGQIEIELTGDKLNGPYALVHFREKNWLLIKMKTRR